MIAFLRVLLIVVSLCAISGNSVAQVKKKVAAPAVTTVRVGDKFVYSIVETRPGKKKAITKRSTLTETVVALDGNYEGKAGARKLIRDTITNTSVYYLSTPGISFSMNEPLAVSPLRRAGQWKTYPLAIAKGKSVKLPPSESVVDLGSSRAISKTYSTMTLAGKEKLRIGKSTYNCVRITETVTEEAFTETVTTASGKVRRTKPKKTIRVATLWYSPELQTLVKYSTKQGNHSFTQHLTKYVSAPEQTAMLEVSGRSRLRD